MCEEKISDLYCAGRNCKYIVGYNVIADQEPCDHVFDNELTFGDCGNLNRQKIGPQKAAGHAMTCDGCREKARKASEDLYNNVAARIAESREHERQRDEERRAKRQAQSSRSQGGHHVSAPPEAPDPPGYGAGAGSVGGYVGYEYPDPQALAMVYGAGTDGSGGQGGPYGYGQAPSALDEDSFASFDALLAEDTADSGRDDPGEGSSHGSGGRHRHRGGRHRHRGGRRHR